MTHCLRISGCNKSKRLFYHQHRQPQLHQFKKKKSLSRKSVSPWFSSVQLFSHVRLFATPWTAACQASLSITNSWSLPKLVSIESVMPSTQLILCCPLLLLPLIPPSIRVFSKESTLHMRQPKYRSFSFSIQRTPRADILQNGLVGSPCSPRDSQESSPTPQFKSINSLAFNFLHSPTLTSIHEHWKNHSLDQTDLCSQSNVSAFQYAIQVGHNFFLLGHTKEFLLKMTELLLLSKWFSFYDIIFFPPRLLYCNSFMVLTTPQIESLVLHKTDPTSDASHTFRVLKPPIFLTTQLQIRGFL